MCGKFQAPLRLLLIWGIIYILRYLKTPILIFMKKIDNSLFGAPNCRPFGEIGGLPIGPKWTNLKIFQSYIVQNPNWKGVSLLKKMPTLVFWAPYCGPFWTYWGVCQSAQNCPILKFLNFLLHEIKIQIQWGSVL